MLKDYNYSSSVLWISWNGSFSRSFILLPYLGLQSNQKSKRLKSCIYQFYCCVNLKIIFQNTCHVKSFFPCKDRLNRSQRSKVIYTACCWYCNDFYIVKTKRRLHDSKTEHFKSDKKWWGSMITLQLLLTISLPPGITSNGIILKS